MLYDVIRIQCGKEDVVFTGDLPKAKAFMKKIRDSQRGMKTKYSLRESDSNTKYKKPRNTMDLSGQTQRPERIK